MHLTFVFMPVALFYFCCIYLPVRENNAYIKPVRGAKKVGDPCPRTLTWEGERENRRKREKKRERGQKGWRERKR